MSKAVDALMGGWQVSGILTLHTGFPITITANDASGTLSGGPRASCIAPATVYGERNAPQGGYLWFNPQLMPSRHQGLSEVAELEHCAVRVWHQSISACRSHSVLRKDNVSIYEESS